jgi:hypothetical protein
LKLKEVSIITGIPYQTLLSWQSKKFPSNDWRSKLVKFLKSVDQKSLEIFFSDSIKLS